MQAPSRLLQAWAAPVSLQRLLDFLAVVHYKACTQPRAQPDALLPFTKCLPCLHKGSRRKPGEGGPDAALPARGEAVSVSVVEA